MPHLNISILLSSAVDPKQAAAVIEDSFETMESTDVLAHDAADVAFDGTVEKRHIVLRCGFEYEERLEDVDLEGLLETFNLKPADELRITATHDTPDDHRLLARICILLAERFSGVIELPGDPFAAAKKLVESPGRLVALREFDEGQPFSEDPACFYCDAAFLRGRAKDPAFSMSV